MVGRRGFITRVGVAIGAVFCGQFANKAEADTADREERIRLYRGYFITVGQTSGLRPGYEWEAQCPTLHLHGGYHGSYDDAKWAVCDFVDSELAGWRRRGQEALPVDTEARVIHHTRLGRSPHGRKLPLRAGARSIPAPTGPHHAGRASYPKCPFRMTLL